MSTLCIGWMGLTPLKNSEILLQESLFYVVITLLVITFLRRSSKTLLNEKLKKSEH